MLTADDLSTLLHCTRQLYQSATLDTFPHILVNVLRQLIAGEYAVMEEMNLLRQRSVGFIDTPGARPVGERIEVFVRHMHEHPLVAHFAETHTSRAHAISDFVSRKEWLATTLQNDLYKFQGVEDQLGAFVGKRGELTVATAIGRPRRSFTDRDRQLLTLLQPHIMQAYRNAELLTDLKIENAALSGESERNGVGIVRVSPRGAVEEITREADQFLGRWFPNWKRRPGRAALPEPIARWLHEMHRAHAHTQPAAAVVPLHIDRPAGRLTINWVGRRGGSTLLLRAATAPGATFKLPPRLQQVLDLLSVGLSEKEVAVRLELSPHTVHRHINRLHEKLGVSSRGELVAMLRHSVG